MHDVEQGLPRRLPASGSSRRPILFSWKFLLPMAVLLAAIALIPLGAHIRPPVAQLTYTELVRSLDSGRVSAITIEPGYGVRGRWRSSTPMRTARSSK